MVTFVNNNEEHMTSIEKLHYEFEEIEEEIITLRVKKYIISMPMKDYIDERLKKSLTEIVNRK